MKRLTVAQRAFVANSQFMAALCPPARENSAAVRSLHAYPEPVGLRPMAIVRLKRTFWHSKFLTLVDSRNGNRCSIGQDACGEAREDALLLVH